MRRLLLLATLLAGAATTPAVAADAACKLSAKQVIEQFIPLFYTQRNAKLAFETWVAPDYIQHNPIAKDGRDNAIAALQPFFDSMKDMRYTVKLVIADGDLVAVHNHLQMTPADRGSAVVDIFRVKDCKIVEHWDVIQAVPEKSANAHPMF